MPFHPDDIEKLKRLTNSLLEDLKHFESLASRLLINGVFVLHSILDDKGEDTHKKLLLTSQLRASIEYLKEFIVNDEKTPADLHVAMQKKFAEMPPSLKADIPLANLCSANTVRIAKTARTATQAEFGFCKSTHTIYITCLSKKTLEHLKVLDSALEKRAQPLKNESIEDDLFGNQACIPGAGTSPH